MTLGQRIAQKRKELGLSQEALGEQLGVSRQAIYKWESDSGLPELEKLIALSRIFSVTVGWLLGVEDGAPGPEPMPPAPEGELTEQQLAMVGEIVDQYLAALPKPMSRKRKLILKCSVALAAVCLVMLFSNLFDQLDRVTDNYMNLQNSIGYLTSDVNAQIGSIAGRVETILKSQNDLTAEWSTQLAASDPVANTATFDVRVVPRTYVEGMTALFLAESGGETAELSVEPGADHSFSGQITCPLTDDISLSVVLLHGDQRQTQWLEDYIGLYAETFPALYPDSWPLDWAVEGDELPATEKTTYPPLQIERLDADSAGPLSTDGEDWELRVGLFRDMELVLWYEELPYEYRLNDEFVTRPAWFRLEDVPLERGRQYTEAIVLTDQYGRQRVYPFHSIFYDESLGEWRSVSDESDHDPSHWVF